LYASVVITSLKGLKSDLFTYSIPKEFTSKVEEGMRIKVPFGNRTLTGFIVSLSPTLPKNLSATEIRQISKLFPEEGKWLLPYQIKLARWMQRYYFASFRDVISCFLPPLVSGKIIKQYYILRGLNTTKSETLLKIFEAIQQAPGINLAGIKKKTNLDNKTLLVRLSYLIQKGIIKEEKVFTDTLFPLQEKYIKLKVLQTPPKMTPLQERIVNFLLFSKKEVSWCKLRNALALNSFSPITSLEKKGIVTVFKTFKTVDPYKQYEWKEFPSLPLSSEQKKALDVIINNRGGKFLLFGVTGSGKTEIYLQAIQYVLAKGKGAIVLVPEITLTSHLMEQFRGRFKDKVVVWHSKLSQQERKSLWWQIKNNSNYVVLGPRSALFVPLASPDLIIVDEEHDTTYKQESPAPYYHAPEVAEKLAEFTGASLVLGAATPSLENFYKAYSKGNFKLLELKERVYSRPLPQVEIIDIKEEHRRKNWTPLSFTLRRALDNVIEKGEKALLFINRRGHSPVLLCRKCGYKATCHYCSTTLVFHLASNKFLCHWCGYEEEPFSVCPKCGNKKLMYLGWGIEKVEKFLKEFYPKVEVFRIDSDTTKSKYSALEFLRKVKSTTNSAILLGTQMIAKGLDIPEVTLVGIINADTTLFFPDFRSGERTFQLLTQVAGRAGRGEVAGRVILQTFFPEHPSIQFAVTQDYLKFYSQEIKARKELGYPPFNKLVRVIVKGEEEKAKETAKFLVKTLKERYSLDFPYILGPSPAPRWQYKGDTFWHFFYKGKGIYKFLRAMKELLSLQKSYKVKIKVDVNPFNLL